MYHLSPVASKSPGTHLGTGAVHKLMGSRHIDLGNLCQAHRGSNPVESTCGLLWDRVRGEGGGTTATFVLYAVDALGSVGSKFES